MLLSQLEWQLASRAVSAGNALDRHVAVCCWEKTPICLLVCVACVHTAFTRVRVLHNNSCFTEGKVAGLFLMDQLLKESVFLGGKKTDSVDG